ncbi:hypothetical protein S83_033344 [Arachis hypogaea]
MRLVILVLCVIVLFSNAGAYDPLDPNGNVTIKWDIVSWTPDGYVADVTLYNFQMFRHIMNPGWTLGWTWAKKEVIWSMIGAQTTEQVTWNVTCTYSQFLARKNPACCLSLSSFYNETITPCPSCACGCQNKRNCVKSDSKILSMVGVHTPKKDNEPLMQCTHHMCPIRVHWHVKQNYKDYWRVKIAITNFNYRMNYSLWTLAIQHPNLNNVTQVFSFDYKPILPYASINDTGMFFGMKYFNDLLMEAGPTGNVQSEVLLQKDKDTFTFKQGWAFPRKVYFNGDECMLPPPDSYPFLPNSSPQTPSAFPALILSLIFFLVL